MAIRRLLPEYVAAFVLVISQAAFGDFIDFTSTDASASEGVGNAAISLTRSAPSSNSAFAYLSLQDITTDGTDYIFAPGEIDGGFNVPEIDYSLGGSATVEWLYEDSAGRIIAGGFWDLVDGSPSPCVTRFLPDGTIDTTFLVNLANGACISHTGSVLANDKVYVTAAYTDALSQIQIYLVRLGNDGSEDLTFTEVRPDRSILTMEVQDSGNILIGGTFGLVNGQVRAAVARVLSDGTLDLSFDTGLPESWRGSGFIHTLITQPDGKILVGGQFDTWGGVATANAVVRLNADGTLDPTFSATTTPNFGPVRDIELLPSGRSLIAHMDGVAMLEADGSLVPGFQVQITGAGNGPQDIEIQDDGKLILTGDITAVGGVAKNSVARVNADGSLDASFDTGIGATGTGPGGKGVPKVSRETSEGTILVGGRWTGFGTSGTIGGVVKLQGSLRTSWGEGEGGDKIIELPIVDDLTYEGDEQLNLQIAVVGGTGVEIGTSSSSVHTIVDNDPYLDTPIGNMTSTTGRAFSTDVSGNFIHPEGSALTFTANGLPGSFSISINGVISGTPSSNDELGSPHMVTITAMDAAGATASDQFLLSVVAPPAPPKKSSGGGAMGIISLLLLSGLFSIKALSTRRQLLRNLD